jgi:hypothetical protein
MARPKRQDKVERYTIYLSSTDLNAINSIRKELFDKERLQADTKSDIVSVTLQRYNTLIGVQKAHGRPQ